MPQRVLESLMQQITTTMSDSHMQRTLSFMCGPFARLPTVDENEELTRFLARSLASHLSSVVMTVVVPGTPSSSLYP